MHIYIWSQRRVEQHVEAAHLAKVDSRGRVRRELDGRHGLLYIYIYIYYIYTYTYIHTHTHTHIYIYINIYI